MHVPDSQHYRDRLERLGLSVDLLARVLGQAAADARTCTRHDAPMTPGVLFWSRANRYLAEELTPYEWLWTQRDSILRVIHPGRGHAVTAISAAGAVADLNGQVRTKNPKGPAMSRLVARTNDLAFMTPDEVLYGVELDDIPTWFLLYIRKGNTIRAELSLPSAMNGQYINAWSERIPVELPTIDIPTDISLPEPPGGGGPDVDVEFLG